MSVEGVQLQEAMRAQDLVQSAWHAFKRFQVCVCTKAPVERDSHVQWHAAADLVICQGRQLRALLTLVGADGHASRSKTGSPGQGGQSGRTAS